MTDQNLCDPKEKTDEEWQEELSEQAFYVCRQAGTEPAFSGEYWDHKGEGVYHCTCCGTALFNSATKFDSGSGWPSFFSPASNEALAAKEDRSFGMVRTEVSCARCHAHLGHVFPDGPPPTGQRYCINSAALQFQPKSD